LSCIYLVAHEPQLETSQISFEENPPGGLPGLRTNQSEQSDGSPCLFPLKTVKNSTF
jgi:hypothetical protein